MNENPIDEIENIVAEMRKDYEKFMDGNNAAGARVRKMCQAIKTKCQDIRIDVQNIKKERTE
jgi:uncharacterized protein YeeX (DUF496 family)